MKIFLLTFLVLITISGCARQDVIKSHGISYLEKREKLVFINKSNKNDVVKFLGQPATKGMNNDNIWIYIERKQTQSNLKNLGKMKVFKNDVLVLEIDNYGILKKKIFIIKMI